MTPLQMQDTLAMAHRVLAEPNASASRRQWADDAIRALEHGDVAAAKRIGLFTGQPTPTMPAAEVAP